MNACIRAVVRTAIYHGLEICGIHRGYEGMIEGDIKRMQSHSVSNIVQRGGTILKSARSMEFMTPEGRKKAFDHLQSLGIEGLVAIGGDGTFTGAKIFFEEFGIPTIGIGAGNGCDGQVLVSYDMLGITSGRQPRFVRNFMSSEGSISLAVSAFVREVKAGTFPSESESY